MTSPAITVPGAEAAPGPARPLPSAAQARRLQQAGAWIVLGAIVPLGAWVCLAPLSMAVVAPAFVKVDLNRRPVQHLEGGIVREVLVRDGQQVEAGAPILLLGDVGVEADRNRIDLRVHTERAALARLEAEQSFAGRIRFAAELRSAAQADPRIREALEKEYSLFVARRDSLDSEIALLGTQRARVGQEIAALEAQVAQAQSSLKLQQAFLDTNVKLVEDGFISPTRISQIEATVADYAAKLEQQRSELARAGQRLGDIDLRIRTMRNQYTQAASDQLKVTAARLAEIEQERRKSDDAAARQVVTAPASGEIIDLRFTSPGAVVRPGEPIAEIVPSDARLMIEAQIRPEDINNVQRGQAARIQFTGYRHRNELMVGGRVNYVSGDRLIDRNTGLPYYAVTIAADGEALRASGDLKLQAGMPAEVYIEGSTQTPLQYLLAPITSTIRKAGREM